ncbi:MAG: Phosphoribosylamine--glycine ligase [Candidatus Saccharibacteria bacterium]|nr:Phosphoribosylamine--glycine ligase [Candidatus Saccharibacteria bacterium]
MSERSALIIGNGGREHAFAKTLGDNVTIYVAPGNAGTGLMSNVTNVVVDDPATFVTEHSIDVTIIGPEAPLVAGVSDNLRSADVTVVGPSQFAAQLESSKSFACNFMDKHGIAYPKSTTVHNLDQYNAITDDATTIVIKADGLAGGKGVVLPESNAVATATLEAMFDGAYDGAGKNGVVIQERLSGPEVSAFALTDGTDFVLLPFAQDHKRLKDGDKGPNTGGMGAYAPVPESIVSPAQYEKIKDIAKKTVDGMKADGHPYQGILYIGVMLAQERGGDPVVIEYNARFGDPEAEVVLTILAEAGVDVYELLKSTDSKLNGELLEGLNLTQSALTICFASAGYPESSHKGDEILGLDTEFPDGVFVHHAATTLNNDGDVVTNGGRVLYVTSVADTIDEAATNAYSVIGDNGVHFEGMQYRTDIGKQARTT